MELDEYDQIVADTHGKGGQLRLWSLLLFIDFEGMKGPEILVVHALAISEHPPPLQTCLHPPLPQNWAKHPLQNIAYLSSQMQ